MKNEDKKWKLAIETLSAEYEADWNAEWCAMRELEMTPLTGNVTWRR